MLSKLTAALLAVLLLYYFPMMQNAKRQEDIAQLNEYRIVGAFVDAVRNKGYLSADMYEDFTAQLGTVLEGFDVELEHRHKKYQPEYSDPANPSTFLEKYSVHEEAHYQAEILEQLFPATAAAAGDTRKYMLSEGDYFDVKVQDHSTKPSSVLGRVLYGEWYAAAETELQYGGMVLNEDY
ncbi:hypothetical protein [Paenibacillus pinistramenti]|uniref:hypothetical protein n=1 Tax=Paenibacillus pinistramenti TaxID=1768003 RepID=UPI001EF0A4FA|nr:hypothetical protein [Paenibacillus pinistramenti]